MNRDNYIWGHGYWDNPYDEEEDYYNQYPPDQWRQYRAGYGAPPFGGDGYVDIAWQHIVMRRWQDFIVHLNHAVRSVRAMVACSAD